MSEVQQFITTEVEGHIYNTINPEWEKIKRAEKYELFLSKSGIPNFYWNIEFEDYEGNKDSIAYKSIKYYADNITDEKFNHVSLYLYGNSSTQKSALGCNILKSAMRQGLRCKFMLSGHLINKLMKIQSYSVDEDISQEIKELKEMDVVLFDDAFDPAKNLMWKGESKNLILCEWDSFLRDLISNGTKIIMTSNFGLDIIKQNYNDFLFELIDRNFASFELTDSVKSIRKLNVSSAFEGVI